jgi:hypothetical protein
MKLPAASGRGIRRYIPFVTPHPNPLPKEREPCGNPAASSGVLKTPSNINIPNIKFNVKKLRRYHKATSK